MYCVPANIAYVRPPFHQLTPTKTYMHNSNHIYTYIYTVFPPTSRTSPLAPTNPSTHTHA